MIVIVDVSLHVGPVIAAAKSVMGELRQLQVIALLAEPADREGIVARLDGISSYTLDIALDPWSLPAELEKSGASVAVIGPWSRSWSSLARIRCLLEVTSSGKTLLSLGEDAQVPPEVPVLGVVLDENHSIARIAEQLQGMFSAAKVVGIIREKGAVARKLEVEFLAFFKEWDARTVRLGTSMFDEPSLIAQTVLAEGIDVVVTSLHGQSTLSAIVTGMLAAPAIHALRQPLLILPADENEPAGTVVVSDMVVNPNLGGRVLIERLGMLGRTPLHMGERFEVVGSDLFLEHHDSVLEVDAKTVADTDSLALKCTRWRTYAAFRVLRMGQGRVVVMDSGLLEDEVVLVAAVTQGMLPVFVRMRAEETLESHRERLCHRRHWPQIPYLVDASAYLDDGGALDVPVEVDSQRLVRIAARMLADGFDVVAAVMREGSRVEHQWVMTLTPDDLRQGRVREFPALASSHVSRQRILTACLMSAGNAISLDIDNRAAREALLAAIGGAQNQVHLESYIISDDPTSEAILNAVAGAAARGVRVRVLVDALHSFHEAFGLQNRLLERLSRVENTEVRSSQPVQGIPSITDLKQRNHRKSIIIDGKLAFVTGRNIGATYYTGFDEVVLTETSNHQEVPWVDVGTQMRGPIVAELQRSFLGDWLRAGGEAFRIDEIEATGEVPCRLVLHDGLEDSNTLEAFLDLIERAQDELVMVNSFPLVVEMQHALIRALQRGVRVKWLMGSTRPRWGDEKSFHGGGWGKEQIFPGTTIEVLADHLIRARAEPVIAAGGEVFEAAVKAQEGWAPALERVYPHVHAKLLVRDAEEVAIGSANIDATSSYWEAELMVVVHDAAFAGSVIQMFEDHRTSARRVDVSAGEWLSESSRRAWLSRNWPNLVG